MRQDKERSIREQADLWKGYWCILACITFGRKSVISYILSESYSIRICRCADRTERRFFSTDPAGESNGRDTD